MASKFAWLNGKRGIILAIAAVVAALVGFGGGHIHPDGFFDGP